MKMLSPEFIKSNSMSAEEYLENIDDEYVERWNRKLDQVAFDKEQIDFLKQDHFPLNIIVFSADWCPDCQNAVPILVKIAELCEYITLKIIDRDTHLDMLEDYKVAGGKRVPFALFMTKDYDELGRWAEKSAFAYELIFDAKKEATMEPDKTMKEIKREKFKENSKIIFNENIRELFEVLKKSIILNAASADQEMIEAAVSN